ncbi:MAG: hypothetical protein LPK80_08385 [Bacteroidota bacterium]|nr:hypothetical protein [Bacteroidota bacterium]
MILDHLMKLFGFLPFKMSMRSVYLSKLVQTLVYDLVLGFKLLAGRA